MRQKITPMKKRCGRKIKEKNLNFLLEDVLERYIMELMSFS